MAPIRRNVAALAAFQAQGHDSCTLHDEDEGLKLCHAIMKSSGTRCRFKVKPADALLRLQAGLLPVCGRHETQDLPIKRCRFILECGKMCGRLTRLKPQEYLTCALHIETRDMFSALPPEMRQAIVDEAIPKGAIARFIGDKPNGDRSYAAVSSLLRVNKLINADVQQTLHKIEARPLPILIESAHVSVMQTMYRSLIYDQNLLEGESQITYLPPGLMAPFDHKKVEVKCAYHHPIADSAVVYPMLENIMRAIDGILPTYKNLADGEESTRKLDVRIRIELSTSEGAVPMPHLVALYKLFIHVFFWRGFSFSSLKLEMQYLNRGPYSYAPYPPTIAKTVGDGVVFEGAAISDTIKETIQDVLLSAWSESQAVVSSALKKEMVAMWHMFRSICVLCHLLLPFNLKQCTEPDEPNWPYTGVFPHPVRTGSEEVNRVMRAARRALFNRARRPLRQYLNLLMDHYKNLKFQNAGLPCRIRLTNGPLMRDQRKQAIVVAEELKAIGFLQPDMTWPATILLDPVSARSHGHGVRDSVWHSNWSLACHMDYALVTPQRVSECEAAPS